MNNTHFCVINCVIILDKHITINTPKQLWTESRKALQPSSWQGRKLRLLEAPYPAWQMAKSSRIDYHREVTEPSIKKICTQLIGLNKQPLNEPDLYYYYHNQINLGITNYKISDIKIKNTNG